MTKNMANITNNSDAGRPRRGRPPIADDLKSLVRTLAESDERLSATQITALVEKRAREDGRDDWPSETSVRRIVRAHRRSDEAERVEFAYVRWPESFATGALPWEAAGTLMPLIRVLDERRLARPTVRRAKWYLRIMLASADLEVLVAYRLAGVMSATEVGRQEAGETWRSVESRLLSPKDAGEAEAVGVSLKGLDLDGAASVMHELSPTMPRAAARDVLELVVRRADAEEAGNHEPA